MKGRRGDGDAQSRAGENERARENINKSHPSDEMEENRAPREHA